MADGDYVDDLILPWGHYPPRGLAVEICGVGSAKVTYSQPGRFLSVWGKQKLTLRNLKIMDFRKLQHSDTDDCLIEVTNDAVLHLTKVTIDSDFAYAQDKKAAISSGHQYPELGKAMTFVVSIRSEVVFTECVVKSGYIGCQLNSSVTASGSKFKRGFFRATNNSTLDLSRCEMVGGDDLGDPESTDVLIQAQCGVSVTIKDSIVEKWHIVAGLRQRDTKVHVENCLLECNIVCLLVFNADATFVGNKIHCNLLLHMEMNTEGKVEFRRNEMIDSEPARFELDKHSKRPVHDFKKVEYYEDQYLQKDRPKAKDKSERAKQFNAAAARGDYIDLRGKEFSTPGDNFEKNCEKCDVSEVIWIRTMKQANRPGWEDVVEAMVGAEALKSGRLKFKHCSACKSVCYCSRECQKADWKDHKQICATYRSARKGDSK